MKAPIFYFGAAPEGGRPISKGGNSNLRAVFYGSPEATRL